MIIFYFLTAAVWWSCNRAVSVDKSEDIQSDVTRDFTQDELEPALYQNCISKEAVHLKKTDENGKIKMEMMYLTPEYSALMSLQEEKPEKESWDTLVKSYAGITQFKLSVSAIGFNDEFIKLDKPEPSVYEERVKYYSFAMQQDIFAVNGNDTISCSIYHFERSYGVSPISTFLLGFEKLPVGNDIRIIIKEKVFSDKELQFDFSSAELKNVPQLKLF